MNDMSGSVPAKAADQVAPPAPPDAAAAAIRKPKLKPLRLQVPFAMRYRGRAAAALVALLIA
jgi:hypothetical protein